MLCLTFCDRQTPLFGTLLYDTFCVEKLCDVLKGRGGFQTLFGDAP